MSSSSQTKPQSTKGKPVTPTRGSGGLQLTKQQQQLAIGAVIVVAIIAVGALILLSGGTESSGIDFASLPQTTLADGAVVLGNPDAPVTIVEFADFACPHCQTYKPEMDRFVREFVVPGKAKYEFRVFPTAGRELTQFAGNALHCAEQAQPGAFWGGYELMYTLAVTGRYRDAGRELATSQNIDYNDLLQCTADATRVQTDVALGQQLGVTGTPAVAVRYGDGAPTWMSVDGRTYSSETSAIPPYDAIAAFVNANTAS